MYKLLDAGDLPAYRFGRVIRIKRTDVEDFLERARVKPNVEHLAEASTDAQGSTEAV